MTMTADALIRYRDRVFKRWDVACQNHDVARDRVRKASEQKARVLLDAWEAGLKMSDIAERVGLSPQRVHQLITEARLARDGNGAP